MTNPHLTILFLLGALLLGGCGQKGALFLPGSPSDVRSEVPSTNASTVPEAETEEAEDEQP